MGQASVEPGQETDRLRKRVANDGKGVPCSWPNESFVENEAGERSSHASTKRPDKGLGFDGKQSDGEDINGAAFAFLRGRGVERSAEVSR